MKSCLGPTQAPASYSRQTTSLPLIVVLILVVGLVSSCQTAPTPGTTATALPPATLAPTTSDTALPTLVPTTTVAATITPEPAATTLPSPEPSAPASLFDGDRAFADVEHQVSLGPRTPGSPGHDAIVQWMQDELSAAGWEVEVQESTWNDHPVRNVVAKRGTGRQPWIILGAHYDSRLLADRDPDPDRRQDPVPGANDGASGVAVLIELARILPDDLNQTIWLAFFDLEDQGDIPGWQWIIGSTIMAESIAAMPEQPQAVIIVDMVGDADLNLPIERNSDPTLVAEIWATAEELGYDHLFLSQPGYSILDDHTPFLRAGIPAVDIIDFDYPYWHTVEDTPDKVSAESLRAVGETVYHWILKRERE